MQAVSSRCCACDCWPAEGSGIQFHPFPKCLKASYTWLMQLKLLNKKVSLGSSKVCSKHFSADQFYVKVDDKGALCNALKPDAMPAKLGEAVKDDYPNFNEAEWKSLEQARNAYIPMKATAIASLQKIKEYDARIQNLEKENQALKGGIKNASEPVNMKKTESKNASKPANLKKTLSRVTKENTNQAKQTLNLDTLGSIVCCLCFETKQHVARVSAFSRFVNQSFLSNVIQICFGLGIQEEDFCTDVCEQCLVRIDITWQFYSKVNANSKALNDLYKSIQCKSDLPVARNPDSRRKISKSAKKSGVTFSRIEQPHIVQKNVRKRTKTKTDNEIDAEYSAVLEPLIDIKQESSNQEDNSDSDSDSDSLPDHPFFTEHSKSVYNCHLCSQTFDRSQMLHVHQLNAHQTDNEQILCHLCAKWFKPRHYNEHVRSIHMDEKCVCTICGQKYSNAANLQRHMLIHTKEKPYTCKLCNAAYNQSTALKLHVMRKHMGIKAPSKRKLPDGTLRPRKVRQPHPCELCDATFVHTTSLEKHVSLVHMGIKPLPKRQRLEGDSKKARASRHMICPVCDQSFFLQSKLISHLEESHPEHKTTIIRCDDCPERFLKQRAYYNHRLYRHSDKTHKCDKCGKIFNCAPHLYTHRRKCYENDLNVPGS